MITSLAREVGQSKMMCFWLNLQKHYTLLIENGSKCNAEIPYKVNFIPIRHFHIPKNWNCILCIRKPFHRRNFQWVILVLQPLEDGLETKQTFWKKLGDLTESWFKSLIDTFGLYPVTFMIVVHVHGIFPPIVCNRVKDSLVQVCRLNSRYEIQFSVLHLLSFQ